jgi:hypothetical protein
MVENQKSSSRTHCIDFKTFDFKTIKDDESKIRMFVLWKEKPETQLLIAGIDAHICDKCIEQAHGIVLEEIKSSSSSKLAGDLMAKAKRN